MKKTALTLSSIAFFLLSTPSYADVQVQFMEGAPKDRFIITNVGDCDLGAAEFTIDFAASHAGLIFDVTGTGAGVEVFQPFEVTAGAQYLTAAPIISDGDQRATLSLKGLGQNEAIAFTIDVDDTNGTREITVTDGEIRGAIVSLVVNKTEYSAVMSSNSKAVIMTSDCDPQAVL
ncbi:MAG: aggregation factor core [Sulfitobacter sp.]